MAERLTGKEGPAQRRQTDAFVGVIQPTLRQRRHRVQHRNLLSLEPRKNATGTGVVLIVGKMETAAAGQWQKDVSQNHIKRKTGQLSAPILRTDAKLDALPIEEMTQPLVTAA